MWEVGVESERRGREKGGGVREEGGRKGEERGNGQRRGVPKSNPPALEPCPASSEGVVYLLLIKYSAHEM